MFIQLMPQKNLKIFIHVMKHHTDLNSLSLKTIKKLMKLESFQLEMLLLNLNLKLFIRFRLNLKKKITTAIYLLIPASIILQHVLILIMEVLLLLMVDILNL